MKFGNKFIYKNRLINTIAFFIITFIILEVIIIKEGFQGEAIHSDMNSPNIVNAVTTAGGIHYDINSPNIANAVRAAMDMPAWEFAEFIKAKNLASSSIGSLALEKGNLAMANIINVKKIASDARMADALKRIPLATCLNSRGIRVSCNTDTLDPCCAVERELILNEVRQIDAAGERVANLEIDKLREVSQIRFRAIYVAFVAGVTGVQFLAADEAAEIALKNGGTSAQIIAAGQAAAIKLGATPAHALLAGEAASVSAFAISKVYAPSTPPPSTPALATPSSNSITPPPKDESSNTILILGGITVVLAGGALLYMSISKA
jgi:hypothetical protein